METLVFWAVLGGAALVIWFLSAREARKKEAARQQGVQRRAEARAALEANRWRRQLDRDSQRAAANVAQHQTLLDEARGRAMYFRAPGDGDRPSGEFILKTLDWRELEFLVAERMRDTWSRVEVTPAQHDGGVDVAAFDEGGNTLALAQVKHFQYAHGRVGRPVVQQLLGAVSVAGAKVAILATTGSLTKDAEEYIIEYLRNKSDSQAEVQVWTRPDVEAWVDSLASERFTEVIAPVVDRLAHAAFRSAANAEQAAQRAKLEAHRPPCPKCSTTMVLRHGRRGAFFGCPRYPDCNGTRPISSREAIAEIEDPWEPAV